MWLKPRAIAAITLLRQTGTLRCDSATHAPTDQRMSVFGSSHSMARPFDDLWALKVRRITGLPAANRLIACRCCRNLMRRGPEMTPSSQLPISTLPSSLLNPRCSSSNASCQTPMHPLASPPSHPQVWLNLETRLSCLDRKSTRLNSSHWE